MGNGSQGKLPMASPATILRNRPLLTLMYGHFTVDMYVGLCPSSIPY